MSGRAPDPEAITLFLTHRCNLRCKMCGQWGESGVTKKMDAGKVSEELPFEVLTVLIDNVSRTRPGITLFGGEPLLYPRCTDLISYIKSRRMHCLMITNGSLLEGHAEGLVGAGCDEINLSLDGPRQLHDEIRGLPGLYDRIVKGVKAINSVKKIRGLDKPLVNLQCTITKYNYERLEELTDVAREIEADSLTFHNLIFLDSSLIEAQKEIDEMLGISSKDWEGFIFEPGIDALTLHKKREKILSARHDFDVDFYPNLSLEGLKEYYGSSAYLPSEYRPKCLSPWITAYVFPDGEIRPCLNFTYSYGNIKEVQFRKAWNGKAALRYRSFIKDKGLFPVCVRCTELYRY